MKQLSKQGVSISFYCMASGAELRQSHRQRRLGLLFSILARDWLGRGGKDVWFLWHPPYIQEETGGVLTRKKKRSDSVLIYFRLVFVFNSLFFPPFSALSPTIPLPEARSFSDTHPCHLISLPVDFPKELFPGSQKLSKASKGITVAKRCILHQENEAPWRWAAVSILPWA